MSANNEAFARFDAANNLNTVEDVAAYLEAVIDEAMMMRRPSLKRWELSLAPAISVRLRGKLG